MTDIENPALEAGEPVVTTEQLDAAATEEGQDESQPADAEDASEKRTKSAERRERRRAEELRLRESEATAIKQVQDAEKRIEALRDAVSKLPQPRMADYADLDQYQAALTGYSVAQTLDQRRLQELEADARAHFEGVGVVRQQQQQEAARNVAAMVDEGRAKYPDFAAVAQGDVQITQDMALIMSDSDVGADLAYYLGKNPDVASAISVLSPVQMARAMGRLEAQISAPQSKTTTTAPAPISPVRPKATPSKDPSNMSPSEWRAFRENGGKL